MEGVVQIFCHQTWIGKKWFFEIFDWCWIISCELSKFSSLCKEILLKKKYKENWKYTKFCWRNIRAKKNRRWFLVNKIWFFEVFDWCWKIFWLEIFKIVIFLMTNFDRRWTNLVSIGNFSWKPKKIFQDLRLMLNDFPIESFQNFHFKMMKYSNKPSEKQI